MFTPLSYFAFLMIALILTLSLFVGLNKIQILQLLDQITPFQKTKRAGGPFHSRIALTNPPHLPTINY
uniref:Cytochrome b6-f complex subunit 6 n=1 Tax=Scoliosorus ensiformis TaxID=38541 RepID=A0A3G5CUI7_9MONI|nr:cytochrome b6/f complex 3.5 kDa subunit [Scoliosorus ensiformis]AYW16525.1 cytochrome b6/f complex 3.5 kDa subunit [Scoliosorus ensiformis]